MAASDTDLILNLVLYAQLQAAETSTSQTTVVPKDVLTQMFLAAGPALVAGGSRLISASVNGKSFAFQVNTRAIHSNLLCER